MAARYGATIVPFAGVGAEDGFNMLLDSEEIRRIPVIGSMIEENSRKTVPRARRSAVLPSPDWQVAKVIGRQAFSIQSVFKGLGC